jgi:hypothetical protein
VARALACLAGSASPRLWLILRLFDARPLWEDHARAGAFVPRRC